MFGFKSKKAEVLHHWIGYAEGFQTSALDFYLSVEKELQNWQVPGLDLSRVEFSEGGLLADKRVYLRMLRERLVFDVCAAPFGTAYFFSCRMAMIPAVVKLWELLVLFFGLFAILALALRYLGIFLGPLALLALLIFAVYTMRNSVAMGLQDLDATLIKTPVIGPIYEAWIRKETYYRFDTRVMYLTIVPDIVKRLAEEVTSAKGVKLVREYENAPILGELYKPVPPRVATVRSG